MSRSTIGLVIHSVLATPKTVYPSVQIVKFCQLPALWGT